MPKKTKTIKKKANPILSADEFSFVLTASEMIAMVQILSIAKDMFEEVAKTYAKDGNEKAQQLYIKRAQTSMALYERVRDVAGIGEPVSREFH